MLCGCMVKHHIQHKTDLTFITFPDQLVHIFHSTKLGIDPVVIGNIISIVVHW